MPNHLHGIVIIIRAKHLNKEFSKNLQHIQKNASPLHQIGTKPDSLSAIMQNFQSVATRKINQIREYIINNPIKWDLDKENPKNLRVKA